MQRTGSPCAASLASCLSLAGGHPGLLSSPSPMPLSLSCCPGGWWALWHVLVPQWQEQETLLSCLGTGARPHRQLRSSCAVPELHPVGRPGEGTAASPSLQTLPPSHPSSPALLPQTLQLVTNSP